MKTAETVEILELNMALKKLSIKPGDTLIIIIQSDSGVDEAVVSRIRQQFQAMYPGEKRVAVFGISSNDTLTVASDGEVTST
jgi:hypothetical protein